MYTLNQPNLLPSSYHTWQRGQSWLWSYGSWINNYLCNHRRLCRVKNMLAGFPWRKIISLRKLVSDLRPIDILTGEIAIEVTGVVGVSPALWYFRYIASIFCQKEKKQDLVFLFLKEKIDDKPIPYLNFKCVVLSGPTQGICISLFFNGSQINFWLDFRLLKLEHREFIFEFI
jgi:hypothetical protein